MRQQFAPAIRASNACRRCGAFSAPDAPRECSWPAGGCTAVLERRDSPRSSGFLIAGERSSGSRSEDHLALVGVVGPAAQRDVLDGRWPLERMWLPVVQLEAWRLRASPATADEGTPAAVPLPDGATDMGRDPPRAFLARTRRPRAARGRHHLAAHLGGGGKDGVLDDLGDV